MNPRRTIISDSCGRRWPMLVDLWARSNAPLTLGFLMEDYVEHLVHHLAQIGVACGAGNL
ncbi:MAG: hypothetical protein ACLP59_10500 [Bryobacteraceae bacterium]